MKKLFLLTDWFPPAYKAGGPIRSCTNIASALSSHWEVWVLTGDRDLGDAQPFASVPLNCWEVQGDGVKVFRAAQGSLQRDCFKQLLRQVSPQAIYFNSIFSLTFSILPLLWLRNDFPEAKVILAPRGMLHRGALRYKSLKKRVFLKLVGAIGLFKRVQFHATDQQESADIQFHLRMPAARISIIPNIPQQPVNILSVNSKNSGQLSLVFISRVAPKKNLAFFLRVLTTHPIQGALSLNVYGNTEEGYWDECMILIQRLPSNITVAYHGSILPAQVTETLQQHHFFLLPTHGENFGHAIFEAFAAGTPVLISNQTPWQELERQKIGWDLPLSAPEAWHKAIQSAIDMDEATYQDWSRAAHGFAQRYFAEQDLVGRYIELFSDLRSQIL